MAHKRRHDLDNLRTFLTCVVIIHHTSNCYGGPGGGPYKSVLIPTVSPASRLPLFVFNAFNQSFFMGIFFWISGRVSAQSLAAIDANPSRTRWAFVRSKLLRLGLPTLFYTLAIDPLVEIAGADHWSIAAIEGILKTYFATLDRVRGPVWYTAALLTFDLVACFATASQTRMKSDKDNDKPKVVNAPVWYILSSRYGWAVVALTSFLTKIYFPIGVTLRPIALQLAFAPQYIFAYIMGYASHKLGAELPLSARFFKHISEQKRQDIEGNTRQSRLASHILMSLVLVPLPQIPQLFSPKQQASVNAINASGIYGGWNPTSFLYSAWNEISFALIWPALVLHFFNKYNTKAESTLFQARNSYGAYLVHMFVSTVIERFIDGAMISMQGLIFGLSGSSIWSATGMVLMTGLVGGVNVIASFAMAEVLLDKIPVLRKII